MKIKVSIFFWAVFAFLFASCNQSEGLGGSSTIEGYVCNVVHQDNNFTFQKDTFPAAGKKVYLNFGDEANVGKKTDAGPNGYFRFDYLREGKYKLYALSETTSGEKIPVFQEVKVNSKKVKADTIYIHSGKAYGTAMIRGYVTAWYVHNGKVISKEPATNVRAFIRHATDSNPKIYFDDVRVAEGYFYFQKLKPGDYVVAVASEDEDRITWLEEFRDSNDPNKLKIIKIRDTDKDFYSGKIYDAGKIDVFVRS